MVTRPRIHLIACVALAASATVGLASASGQAEQGAAEASETPPEPPADDEYEEEEFEPPPPPFVQPTLDPAHAAIALTTGERVYRSYCATCHGRTGNGRGPSARFLRVPPRNFRTGAYKFRTTPSGSLPTDADILRTIRRGVPGTEMPRWAGRLPDSELRAVTQYIKMFSPRFGDEEIMNPIPMPTTTPAFDEGTAARGRMLYVLMRCWTCHGINGDGDGTAADTLRDDSGREIAAQDFTSEPLRSGGRPLDVFRTFTTGVNGTPMPSFDEALLVGRDAFEDLGDYATVTSDEERVELRAFIDRLPLTDEIWELSEAERRAWASQLRWDLVGYVMGLRSSGPLGYIGTDPYATD